MSINLLLQGIERLLDNSDEYKDLSAEEKLTIYDLYIKQLVLNKKEIEDKLNYTLSLLDTAEDKIKKLNEHDSETNVRLVETSKELYDAKEKIRKLEKEIEIYKNQDAVEKLYITTEALMRALNIKQCNNCGYYD